jgi:hypothetical protein
MNVLRFTTAQGSTILVETRSLSVAPDDPTLVTMPDQAGGLGALLGTKAERTTGDETRSAFGSAIAARAQQSLEDTLAAVAPMIESIHDAVANVERPIDSVEVSFGVVVSASANAIIAAGSEANIGFKMLWKPAHRGRNGAEPG